MKSKEFLLSLETKVRVVATHKETFQEFETIVTLKEWRSFQKNKNYFYKAYEII
jgi:hypothetical protein